MPGVPRLVPSQSAVDTDQWHTYERCSHHTVAGRLRIFTGFPSFAVTTTCSGHGPKQPQYVVVQLEKSNTSWPISKWIDAPVQLPDGDVGKGRFVLGMDTTTALLWVVVVAALAPIVVDFLPIPKVPVVVLELVLGAIFGPHVLNLISEPGSLHHLQEFGVIFLFFLAGFEVDMSGLLGRPIKNAVYAWLSSLVIALGITLLLQEMGLITNWYMFGIAFSTTALGPIMPMLADRKLLGTGFGNNVISIGAIGEFGPVLLIAFLLNQSRSALTTASLILVFGVACVILLRRMISMMHEGRHNRLIRLAMTSFHSTSQFAVRLSLVILVFLVFLTERFELDVLLGAFAAGFIIGQMGEVVSEAAAERYMGTILGKLESIGYGVFIPVFFILTGAGLNLTALVESTRALIALPIVVVGSFVIRGLPTYFIYHDVEFRMRRRLALMSATQLPLVATLMATYIGRDYIAEDLATAIILGCVLTVAIFPLLAFIGLTNEEATANDEENDEESDEEAISEKSVANPAS